MAAEHPHALYLQTSQKDFPKTKDLYICKSSKCPTEKLVEDFLWKGNLEYLLVIQRKTSTKSSTLKTIQAPKRAKIFLENISINIKINFLMDIQRIYKKTARNKRPAYLQVLEMFYRKACRMFYMGEPQRNCRGPSCFRRPLKNISAIEDLQMDCLIHRRRVDIFVSK